MEYYARSENSSGKRETVQHHLLRCAKLAAEFGQAFDNRNECEIMALFHDVGKCSYKFAKVLDRQLTRVNHEAAGALLIKGYLNNYSSTANALSIAIYAHHKGLQYAINDLLTNSFRQLNSDDGTRSFAISGKNEYEKCFDYLNKIICLPKYSFKQPDYRSCNNPKIAEMLYIRMLLSCLVDADYSSSAEHFDPDYLKKSTSKPLDAEEKLKKLLEYKNNISKNSVSDKEINKIREKVFSDCLNAGEKQPGLFTLTAPTGTGKTLALLAFALRHAQINKKRRIILVLPFLSIIEQNAAIYREIMGHLLEAHSLSEYTEESKLYSERWSSPFIITTSVKFFEMLFKSKPTDLRALHSIAESVIVFDEAQSLPPHLLAATTDSINCICRKYNSTVVFSTATQPSLNYRIDIEWEPKEICTNSQELYDKTKRVDVVWDVKNKTKFSEIANKMSESESCCAIVNMKRHSIELFNLLLEISENDSCFYLSTTMCAEHRTVVIKQIRERLENNLPCKVVSTQCIEAGVDLDFKLIFRAIAPLDSIIQSAGRCNRNGKQKIGQVIVFEPDDKNNYPDSYYEIAANTVKLLLYDFNGSIDISDLSVIDKYYEKLFSANFSDKAELRKAIEKIDFSETEKNYRLIQKGGVNIIVPYKGKMELFNSIREQAIEEGITPKIIQKARGITISNFDKKSVEELCFQLKFNGKYGKEEFTNWYIPAEKSLYKDKTGFYIDKSTFISTTY